MMSRNEIIKEVKGLRETSRQILVDEAVAKRPEIAKENGLQKSDSTSHLSSRYQSWYTQCLRVIRAVAPERLEDFVNSYEYNKGKQDFAFTSYKIKHYLLDAVFPGRSFQPFEAFVAQLNLQISILDGVIGVLDSKLSDITSELQYEVLEDELGTAASLAKAGHLRAAGAVSGVVLESHLKSVASAKQITLRKKAPSISDYNDALKELGTIDTPTWRFIQRLGDIRNLCVHSKDDDPTKDQVTDMINGTKKILADVN